MKIPLKNVEIGAPGLLSTSPTLTSYTFSVTTYSHQWAFQAEEDVLISKLGFGIRYKAGSPGVYSVSLHPLIPNSGFALKENPLISGFANISSLPIGFNWIDTESTYQATKGEFLAVRIGYHSGTINGSHNFSPSFTFDGVDAKSLPYPINDLSSPSKGSTMPVYGYGNSNVLYGRPVHDVLSISYNTGSSYLDYGMRFKLSGDSNSTYSIRAVNTTCSMSTSSGFYVKILDENNMSLQSGFFNPQYASSSIKVNSYTFSGDYANLNFNSGYKVVFSPVGPQSVGLYFIKVSNSGDGASFDGGGDFGFVCKHRTSGIWVESGHRPLMSLSLEEFNIQPPAAPRFQFNNLSRIAF